VSCKNKNMEWLQFSNISHLNLNHHICTHFPQTLYIYIYPFCRPSEQFS
jgi:hypothetical protein